MLIMTPCLADDVLHPKYDPFMTERSYLGPIPGRFGNPYDQLVMTLPAI
jgi:hypothetical protein